jgi:transposase
LNFTWLQGKVQAGPDELVGKTGNETGVFKLKSMSGTRRKFSSALKAKGAIEAINEQHTISELAKEFEVHLNQVSQWKREFLERSVQVFEGDRKQAAEIGRIEQEQKVEHERIGNLTIKSEFFKELGLLP